MISGKAKIAGVIGYPVSHSLSPKLHGFWLDKHNIDGAYIPLEVSPENLRDVILALPKMGFRGVNITVPHKEAVMEWMDEIDELAGMIGAVNTVVVKDRKLIGMNTDCGGFLRNIEPANNLETLHRAVVIGAGGAARAVIAALQFHDRNAEIILTNRTRAKAEELAAHFFWWKKITVVDWEERHRMLEGVDLLVNTTSLGMIGQPPLELDLAALPKTALVTDIVYKPLETALLKAARERGNKTVDGLGMLLHQAARGFELWFGVKPEVTQDLRNHILNNNNI